MATPFTVNSKDLFDREKNPNLSLSVHDIEQNPNIPKHYTGKWIFEHHQSEGIIGTKPKTGSNLVYILRDKELVRRFADKQDELTDLTIDDIFTKGDHLYNKRAVIIAYSDEHDHMDYFVGLREGEDKIKRHHLSVPHHNPFEIKEADLDACLQKPDKMAYDCITKKRTELKGLWD